MRAITVLKVGGSVARTDAAARLMRALASRKIRDLLVVPGGGEFADAVRAAQAMQGFSDAAAHHMALLAMQAMAVALCDFAPGFMLAESPGEFEIAWQSGDTPVWLPAQMVLAAADIPASWDVTSDSLAAWLAGKVSAARLLLVKTCALPAESSSARALTEAGVVDAAFARYVEGRAFSWRVVSGVNAALEALGT
jgi:5-(aminomethyl)-3-furanmethanol phosphate kinase